MPALGRIARALAALVALATLGGCPAVYPELGTGVHKAPPERVLEPAPPEDMRWIRIVSARIPERARDGRTWGQAFGSLPDPYAKLFVDNKELIRTPAQADTLEPTWPSAPRGNFRIARDAKLRIEIWDNNPINDRPIGVRDLGRVSEEQRIGKQIRVELDGGAEVIIAYEAAHAMLGLGLWYELRSETVYITRMLEQSPAERAGLIRGDQVVQIAGRAVELMTPDEVRSAFGSVPVSGIPLLVQHPDGATLTVTLKEGPIYPTFGQFGAID
ncbi:MAG: PDZ domain-containing protein [Polyangiaceae bacterium]